MPYRLILLCALVLPLLQACFPVVAAVVATGVLVAEDRRTSGTVVEDQDISLKADGAISAKLKGQAHINITSYNRIVLLTGEAPNDAVKAEIELLVKSIENVRGVHNEVVVAGASSFAARSNDTYITSKVKARFLDARKFQLNHVKVVTESGVVYLLGIVSRQEAKDAVEIASSTGRVQKVVTVFEYLD